MFNRKRRQSPDTADDQNQGGNLRGLLVSLGIGLAAQYTLTHGFPLVGGVGYGIAVWLFISHVGGQTADPVGDQPELDWKLILQEIRARFSSVEIIKNNWRDLTIYEIISGSYKLQKEQDEHSVPLGEDK